MQIKHAELFSKGYEVLVSRNGPNADMLQDFAHLGIAEGGKWTSPAGDERAFLLARGNVEFSWNSGGKSQSAQGRRKNLFDENPSVLNVPADAEVSVQSLSGDAELYVMATSNPVYFTPRFYTPQECRGEERGKGTMNETSTRVVRTVFDDSNAPWSNLVVGEVITIPGKWSSYPPHHHAQPEIYHYRMLPEQGFGIAVIGEKPYFVTDRDTVLIRDGQDHPQVAAPGYAMWYLWVIRHLEGNRYRNPTFTKAHEWVQDPKAKIWAFKPEGTATGEQR